MKFLVQIEDEPETRWLQSPNELRRTLEQTAHCAVSWATAGPVPRVFVIQEEVPDHEMKKEDK
jgi:hypothetical protein